MFNFIDNRVEIKNPRENPYKAIGKLVAYFETTYQVGTAFFIGENVLLTVAHVIYKHPNTKPEKL